MSARLPPINVVLAQSAATPRRRGEPPAPSARKRGRSTALAALLPDATDNVLVRELGSADSRRRAPARFVAGPASGKIPKPVVLDAVVVEVDDADVEVESETESMPEDAGVAAPPGGATLAARLRPAAAGSARRSRPPTRPTRPTPRRARPAAAAVAAAAAAAAHCNASWRRPRQPPALAPDRCAKDPFAPSRVVPLV